MTWRDARKRELEGSRGFFLSLRVDQRRQRLLDAQSHIPVFHGKSHVADKQFGLFPVQALNQFFPFRFLKTDQLLKDGPGVEDDVSPLVIMDDPAMAEE